MKKKTLAAFLEMSTVLAFASVCYADDGVEAVIGNRPVMH